MGLSLGPRQRQRTEESLEELTLLARSAGPRCWAPWCRSAPGATPPPWWAAASWRRSQSRSRTSGANLLVFDDELSPGAAAQRREGGGGQGHRPHPADPRHLRPPGADPGGAAPGGAGPAELLPPAPRRAGEPAVAPGRRHRHAGSGRDQARDRSAADPSADPGRRSARSSTCDASGRPAGRDAGVRTPRWWPWSATPTRGSRPCSTR